MDKELSKLKKVIEQSPISIVITDMKGKIEYVNPHFCQITGYTMDEAIGANPRVLKSEYTSSMEYKDLWETITKEWDLLTDGYLQTTEPVEVNERDLISLQVNYGLNPSMSICKIWIKNIDVSFQSFD